MAQRKAISKKTRFEIFKRDGFKCTYCGAEAPKAILHVDHIHPVAKGGDNDMLNLTTACSDCNGGKSDRLLSDDSAIAKQRSQLDELHERREQMEMMLRWREAMTDIADDQLKAVQEHFSRVFPGWSVKTDGAVKQLKGYLRKHGMMAVMDAIDLAAERYVKSDADGKPIPETIQEAWHKVGGILHVQSKSPEQQRLHYVKGILNKRLSYVPFTVMRELESALEDGVDVESMVDEAKVTRSWSAFSRWLEG